MQWSSSFFNQDPFDPLSLNDDTNDALYALNPSLTSPFPTTGLSVHASTPNLILNVLHAPTKSLHSQSQSLSLSSTNLTSTTDVTPQHLNLNFTNTKDTYNALKNSSTSKHFSSSNSSSDLTTESLSPLSSISPFSVNCNPSNDIDNEIFPDIVNTTNLFSSNVDQAFLSLCSTNTTNSPVLKSQNYIPTSAIEVGVADDAFINNMNPISTLSLNLSFENDLVIAATDDMDVVRPAFDVQNDIMNESSPLNVDVDLEQFGPASQYHIPLSADPEEDDVDADVDSEPNANANANADTVVRAERETEVDFQLSDIEDDYSTNTKTTNNNSNTNASNSISNNVHMLIENAEDEEYDESQKNTFTIISGNKKISDSRLSLAQLSIVLHLEGNEEETAKREKNILQILRKELDFPIGEKTWIRDTPSHERERIIKQLTSMVEDTYHYGYSKRTLSIIVRRASYYMMQGRLRRERRQQRKRKQNQVLNQKRINSETSEHDSE